MTTRTYATIQPPERQTADDTIPSTDDTATASTDDTATATASTATAAEDDAEGADDDAYDDADDATSADQHTRSRRRRATPSPRKRALLVAVTILAALVGVAGWNGWQLHHSQQTQRERDLYLQVARQGALNLTTIDWQHADTDVQRILASATGQFYDEFSKRAQDFTDVVKQVQSKSTGTITAAGLENSTADGAQALVAVNVEIADVTAPQQQPRAWRMRVTVSKAGNDVKVSNVEFVP